MKYFEKIKGKRIYLSPLSLEDSEIYTKWLNGISISDGLGSTHKVVSLEGEKEWLSNVLKNGDYTFAIIKRDGNTLLGNASIMDVNPVCRTGTLGIFIGEQKERNKGYGAEALKLLLDYGFNILNLNNINLAVFSFNKNAIACYKKIGFKEYGVRHECYFLNGKYYDEILMEILRKDY